MLDSFGAHVICFFTFRHWWPVQATTLFQLTPQILPFQVGKGPVLVSAGARVGSGENYGINEQAHVDRGRFELCDWTGGQHNQEETV